MFRERPAWSSDCSRLMRFLKLIAEHRFRGNTHWISVLFLALCCFVEAQTPPAAAPQPQSTNPPVAVLRGTVKSGNKPIPGATVTAINADTRQRTSTWTDVDGSYALPI